jgi:hypothetical protein
MQAADEIFSITMYLKTSVVGMNNNQLQLRLNSNQTALAEMYCTATNN